jgi:hypothetical protein
MNNNTFTDDDNGRRAEVVPTNALATQAREEFDVSVVTAHRFPRSLQKFRTVALSMATIDAEVAASCFYRLSRKGQDGSKAIEGPTVRFAEIVANAYGNMKFGARILEVGEKEVVAQGIAHDLENNVSTSTEVRRRITTKTGARFGDDMIAVTCNAACSLALRNAIFKAVPFAIAKPIYEQAKKVAVGDAKTLSQRRTSAMAAFAAMGISAARVFARLEVAGSDEITLAHLEELIGLHTSIKEGEVDADAEFPEIQKKQASALADIKPFEKKDKPADPPAKQAEQQTKQPEPPAKQTYAPIDPRALQEAINRAAGSHAKGSGGMLADLVAFLGYAIETTANIKPEDHARVLAWANEVDGAPA